MAEMVPAIDRARRLLARIDGPAGEAISTLVDDVAQAAAADGVELQAEFGPGHVAIIAGCNQFGRFLRDPPGLELWLEDDAKARLAAAGIRAGEPEGAVFRMFGWIRLDADVLPDPAVRRAVADAYRRARAQAGETTPG